MSADNLIDLPAATLAWANGVRACFNAPPLDSLPKGIPGNGHDCVVSRCFKSIGRGADRYGAVTTTYGRTTLIIGRDDDIRHVHTFMHPNSVERFVHAFDHGHFKEFIDDPSTAEIMGFAEFPAKISTEKEAFKNIAIYLPKPATSLIPTAVVKWFDLSAIPAIAGSS